MKYLLTQSLCIKEEENACHKHKEEFEIHNWIKKTHTHTKQRFCINVVLVNKEKSQCTEMSVQKN